MFVVGSAVASWGANNGASDLVKTNAKPKISVAAQILIALGVMLIALIPSHGKSTPDCVTAP